MVPGPGLKTVAWPPRESLRGEPPVEAGSEGDWKTRLGKVVLGVIEAEHDDELQLTPGV